MKNRAWLIIFLLVIWCGFSNNFKPHNIVLGIIFSSVITYLVIPKKLNFRVNVFQMLLLFLYTIWELIRSSLEVAWDIITPKSKSQPKIIKLPLLCKHPLQISLFTNLISLTPGTLAVDIDEKNATVIIHVMFSQYEKQTVAFMKDVLEQKIIKVIQHG